MASREGRIRACQGCREQKVRCELPNDPNGRCSRCNRMGLDCVKGGSTKRNRQSKAALQRELDYLKQQMRDTSNSIETPPSPSCWPREGEGDPDRGDVQSGSMLPLPLPSPISNTYSGLSRVPNFEENMLDDPNSSRQTATLPRMLDGREYDGLKIDNCFAIFFKDFAPILPIIDPALSPNTCYEQSPFLFWTILVIGCRRYIDDPTMLEYIGSRVNRIAFASLSARIAPVQTIQGLLLLCTWPAPLKSMAKDMSYVSSGAAIHLAMQIGLHIPGVGQDFSPNKLRSTIGERLFRERLWLLACVVCQLTSYGEGLPPIVTIDFPNLGLKDGMLVSDKVKFHSELHRIQASAMCALMRQAVLSDPLPLPPNSSPQHAVLNALIKSYDTELNGLAGQVTEQQKILYLNCGRLHVNSFLFFSTPNSTEDLDHDGLVQLYDIACKVIDGVKLAFQRNHTEASCPAYVHRTMTLAAFIILKISRSCLAERVDLRRGEKAYFATIITLRESSLENNDLYTRGAMILAQLWTSTIAFRRSDGIVDGLSLRIRTRLSMSIVFDCFWWWREEFQGKPSPYNCLDMQEARGKIIQAQGSFPEFFPAETTFTGTGAGSDIFVEPFPDYEWANNFEFETTGSISF